MSHCRYRNRVPKIEVIIFFIFILIYFPQRNDVKYLVMYHIFNEITLLWEHFVIGLFKNEKMHVIFEIDKGVGKVFINTMISSNMLNCFQTQL